MSIAIQADEALDRKQAAAYLGTTAGTLNYWASVGRYDIPYYRVGRKAVYRRSDLDAWLQKRRVSCSQSPKKTQ